MMELAPTTRGAASVFLLNKGAVYRADDEAFTADIRPRKVSENEEECDFFGRSRRL